MLEISEGPVPSDEAVLPQVWQPRPVSAAPAPGACFDDVVVVVVVVVAAAAVVVVGIWACKDLQVKLFRICIKTKHAPRLHEVLVY